MSRYSSALNGLIPKSTGGRMALAGGGALAVAAGVSSYRRNRSQSQLNQEMNAFDRLPRSERERITLQSAYDISTEQGDYMRQRIAAGNFPTF